jgi:transposase, IS30 family
LSRQYKHVSLAERVEIEKLLDQGVFQAEIARRLRRSRSTISREIKRRSWRPSSTSAAYTPYRPAGLRTGEWTKKQYRATIAQAHADRATERSHQAQRMRDDRLVGYVRERLRRGWTPEEIAGRLPVEFPNDAAMRVSHETLYAWIYAPSQRELGLWQYLPRGRGKRRRGARPARFVGHHRSRCGSRSTTAQPWLRTGPSSGTGKPTASSVRGAPARYIPRSNEPADSWSPPESRPSLPKPPWPPSTR